MITVGYSTRESKPEFIEYLKKSSGYKKLEVIEKINNGDKSLSQVYNEILSEAKTDIVVLCHDDIYFDTSSWYSKLLKHFEKTEYGIIGMAGTTSMPSTGMWWQDRKKMVGIVNHENGGKKWESKYADSVGNSILETVIVDGLFIAIHKKRIKKTFNEEFKGFHFYDIPFCFENHLEGVKVGVITNIRITHKSIGQTNEQWEENRKIFAEKYKYILPVKVKIDLKKLHNFKIMLADDNYEKYEKIIKILQKNKFIVSFLGNFQNENDIKRLKQKNVKYYSTSEPYGFKIGDGKWGFNSQNGPVISELNKVYKIKDFDYDLIHTTNSEMENYLKSIYPNSNLFIQEKNYENEEDLINDYENFLNG